jgi:hypothetical protein
MNKTQVVNEMIRVYDENEQLRRENDQLKKGTVPLSDGKNRIPSLDSKIIEAGRKLLFANVFRFVKNNEYYDREYEALDVEVRDDSGKMNFITYDQWLKSIDAFQIRKGCVDFLENTPLFVIKDYFDKELHDFYTDLVNKKKGEILAQAKDAKPNV